MAVVEGHPKLGLAITHALAQGDEPFIEQPLEKPRATFAEYHERDRRRLGRCRQRTFPIAFEE